MRTVEYLDAAKKAANLPSDYALAARLGVTRGAISSYRTERTVPETLIAVRLAELIGADPMRVVADIELEKAERSHRDEQASAWRGILGKLGGAAAGLAMAVGVTAVSAPSSASAETLRHQFDNNAHSRKSKRRRLLASIDRMLHGMQAAPAF